MTLTRTYDAGALIAAEANNDRMWALHELALSRGMRVTDCHNYSKAARSSQWVRPELAPLAHCVLGRELQTLSMRR